MREALTVIGFLLILALAAIFAAPLYVDWNDWRETIAARLSDHLGTEVKISGRVEARLLPQPWLSIGGVAIGDPAGSTTLAIGTVSGDVSLTSLMRGDVEISNVVLASPKLAITTDAKGGVTPLTQQAVDAAATIDSFEIQDGSIRYVDAPSGQDVTIEGVQLVGEARSVVGPFKAEGGLQVAGVPHTVKISTGSIDAGQMKVKATFVPADRPMTIDFDGTLKVTGTKPSFVGLATVARPALNARGDKAPPEEPWIVAARMTLTPEAMAADAVSIQVGPDERALKLTGTATAQLGKAPRFEAAFTATQLELDRLAGVTPDHRLAPLVVLGRIRDSMPSVRSIALPGRVQLSAQAMIVGGNLVENVKADLTSAGSGWRIANFEAGLPGQSRFVLAGDVDASRTEDALAGSFSLASRQASTLMNWLRGDDLTAAPNAARRLTLDGRIAAGADSLTFDSLKLAVDDASVEGRVAWSRVQPDTSAGRIEADLTAQRLDLDVLPSAIALLPGGASAISEADVKLSAQSIAFAGVEAKSASGRIKAGGKLIVLEDVTIDDLGGSSLTANGRIDVIGERSTGEVRVTVDARDLTGLAKALRRSPLPPTLLDAFGTRAAALSPASVVVVTSFGDGRRLSLNGKLGGTVAQVDVDLPQSSGRNALDIRLAADSLDIGRLLKQIGLSPAPAKIPGRTRVVARLTGPLDGPRQWSGRFEGGGVEMSGSGTLTGGIEAPAIEGRVKARTNDVLTPAQLFGVSIPGALVGDAADVETALRVRGGRVVLDDLRGEAMGVPVSGRLAFDPGTPVRVEGQLAFDSLDGTRFASLLAGTDLAGPPAAGSAWSGDAFGPTTFAGLAGTLSLSAKDVNLSDGLPALHDVAATLSLQPGSVGIDEMEGSLAGGSVDGFLRLSRSAMEAALTGRLAFKGIDLDTPDISGRLDMAFDLQGTGRTPALLAGSLTGGGTIGVRGPRFGRLSDQAFSSVVSAVDGGMPPQIARLRPLFEDKLAAGPLTASDFSGTLSLAGGVARLATTTAMAGETGLSVSGSLDLATMTAKADVVLSPPAPADGLGGHPPLIGVSTAGRLDDLRRQVDVSQLTAWLTVRSAEREAKKLEALEAERLARETALEEQRRIEAERIQKAIDAQEKAAREKAERERLAKEKADREKAEKERAAKEKADRERADREKADREKADREKALQGNTVAPPLPEPDFPPDVPAPTAPPPQPLRGEGPPAVPPPAGVASPISATAGPVTVTPAARTSTDGPSAAPPGGPVRPAVPEPIVDVPDAGTAATPARPTGAIRPPRPKPPSSTDLF